jgi:exopolyphosphatase/guanosine-5'-triphosphate,3'-diphosphate pyrophosphatase
MTPPATRIAAIDVGSNSVLLCVGEVLGRSDYRVIYDSARTTRLCEGMGKTGRLSPKAIHRTVEVLEECRRKTQILGVGIAKAVATAAVREAGNAESFLASAKDALGFAVEPISGEREAELTFLGVTGGEDPVLIVDVGGASTEIILGRDGKIERSESLPIGARRLKEAIPSEDILRFFVRVIQVIPTDLSPAEAIGRRALAVGGTATTLAAVRLGLTRYESERIEGLPFTRTELAAMVDRLQGLEAAERYTLPGLPSTRADIISSGALILLQVLEDLGVEEFAVSSRGLRHGLLGELARGKM